MKPFPTIVAVLLLLPAVALAGAARDACLQEEKELRAEEAVKCHGFRYIIDPSGCFATQRALKEYDSGKCAEIGAKPEKQQGDPAPTAPVPAPAVPKNTPAPPEAAAAPAPPAAAPKIEEKTAPVAAEPVDECGRVRAENDRLKAEVASLRAEVERLRTRGEGR